MLGIDLMRDPAIQAFRADVKQFCEQNLPCDIRDKVLAGQHLAKADYVRWQKILFDKGWIVGHWPRPYGGQDWTPLQRAIFDDETSKAGAPWLTPFGVCYAGPVIYTFGSETQKDRFLPGIRSTDTWWCQGYSEPGAGSDLANIKTRAVRDGDHYLVNGQKTWTTMAQWADMMFALVRTSSDGKPQNGISFLLIDMNSPGITVRPIISIDKCHHLNEVFLDDVRVPVENLVGEEGRGWTYAKFLLNNERLLGAEVGKSTRLLNQLRQTLADIRDGGRPLSDDPHWRRRLGELRARLLALEAVCNEYLAAAEAGSTPGLEVSALKIMGSELIQGITGAMVDALAVKGLVYQTDALEPGWQAPLVGVPGAPGMIREHLHDRATTIYGGANEIQRNILAKAVLGL